MKNKKVRIVNILIICLVVTGSLGLTLAAQADRGLSINQAKITDKQGKEVLLYTESHALLIGMSEYTTWPKLPGVKRDIEAIRAALEAQGFDVVVYTDLDKNGLDKAFGDFIGKYGQNPENRLLFYFAGHGHTVRMSYGEELGYIVPVDAPNPYQDPVTFQSKAMAMQQIEIYAKQVQSKHAMFMFDACFSGSLFALSRAVPEIIGYKTAQPVRQFITSGSADETVPDESIFRTQFERALQGEADNDKDGYVTGTELGEFLQTTVVNYSRNAQHPQYGKIRNPNLDKGDFVFKLPMTVADQSTVISPPEITTSFDDIDAQLRWQDYIAGMEETFAKLGRYDEINTPAESKKVAWERFLTAFSEDNPYSIRDDELRNLASEKILHWETVMRPTPIPTALPTPTPRPDRPPSLKLLSEAPFETDRDTLEIKGMVTDDLGIKDVKITVRTPGKQAVTVENTFRKGRQDFSANVRLNVGQNEITIQTTDTIGQFAKQVFTVVRTETVFRLNSIVIKDAKGKVIEPVKDIYYIKVGQVVTITANAEYPSNHKIEAAWTTRNGRVPVNSSMTNTYLAPKTPGSDYVIIYIIDKTTGSQIEKPINITVVQ